MIFGLKCPTLICAQKCSECGRKDPFSLDGRIWIRYSSILFSVAFIIFLQTAKMKKWVALLGGAMFIVLFLSMYMVVDQLGKSPSYKELIDMQVMLDL